VKKVAGLFKRFRTDIAYMRAVQGGIQSVLGVLAVLGTCVYVVAAIVSIFGEKRVVAFYEKHPRWFTFGATTAGTGIVVSLYLLNQRMEARIKKIVHEIEYGAHPAI
jgi:mannose/fructose/N-acetylgalactosamine-specific phosphotransferase system component IIC